MRRPGTRIHGGVLDDARIRPSPNCSGQCLYAFNFSANAVRNFATFGLMTYVQ